jgi:hypothetical protein
VRRFVLENRLPDWQFYQLLTNFGYECLRKIAMPFDTPVWVMHQLSGASNSRGWGAKQSHADAQGSKSFAENMWYSFQLGTLNKEHDAAKLWCTKARRSDAGREQLVYLQKPVSTMRAADHLVDMHGMLRAKSEGSVHAPSTNGSARRAGGASASELSILEPDV